jgi:hypothetical protein
LSDKQEQEIQMEARRMGMDFQRMSTAKNEVSKQELRFIDVYGKRGTDELTRPVISTAEYRIGLKEHYNPPVGFAKAPTGTLHSEGNEKYVVLF